MNRAVALLAGLAIGGCASRVWAAGAPGSITTVAGISGSTNTGYAGDGGLATAAKLNWPTGVCVDASGDLYIADQLNRCVRYVDATSGVISTVAGDYGLGFGYSGDNGPATLATLVGPNDVALDSSGNLYIADSGNNAVREVDHLTHVITTIAGNGNGGYAGDNGPASLSQLNNPISLAFDPSGNLYIADMGNDRVRVIDHATRFISTAAGTGVLSFSGDGGSATAAALYNPDGVACDQAGNLFISDQTNGRVREVSATNHFIQTVAGNGNVGYGGDLGAATLATLSGPAGLWADAAGNLYVADSGNNRVRSVNLLSGIITTLAGNGVSGDTGDGGPATSAEMSGPEGLGMDPSGNLYIAEQYDSSVRVVVDAAGAPVASPTPSASPSPTLSPSSSATPTPSLTGTGTLTSTGTPSPVPTGTPSAIPSPSRTASPSPASTRSPTPAGTSTPSASPSPTFSATPSATTSACEGGLATVQILPSNPAVGQGFAVVLTLSNSGTGVWGGISVSPPIVSPAGILAFAGPASLAAVSLNPGQSTTFAWTYTRTGNAAVQIQAAACGLEVCDGVPLCVTSAVAALGGPVSPTPNAGTGESAGPGQAFVYPAPVTGSSFRFAYFLRSPGTVRIRVYNERAQLASVLTDSPPVGPQSSPMNAGGLAPGVYFYLVDLQYQDGTRETLPVHKFLRLR